MKRTEYFSIPAVVFSACVLTLSVGAGAAEEAGIKSLEGKNRGGKIMTKDELRACMKRQDDLARDRVALDARRDAMTKERAAIDAETAAIKAQNDAFKQKSGSINEFNERIAALNARAEAYKKAVEEFQGMPAGPRADRKRRELDAELAAIKKEEAANKSDGEAIQASVEGEAKALNQRVQAHGDLANDWNERSKTLEKEADAYEDRRLDWRTTCGDRRYREDDEKAIRAGK